MPTDKSQTTVLVTGASSGIGKETARTLRGEGYVVYGAARRVGKMTDLEAIGVTPIAMDVTRDEDLVAAVEQITVETGGVDALVNNAGFATYGAMEDTPIADARYQFEVNLFGLARLTQLVLPHMREQGHGRIVNMSSMGGRIYTPLGSWYHATKHALEGWSDCLRYELAPFGIDVVIIQPGSIETEFGDVMVPPLLERSGSGPYAEMAQEMARVSRKAYESGGGSPPAAVASAVSNALSARRPKTRYAVGKLARPLLFLRKWAGDRIFDRVISRMA